MKKSKNPEDLIQKLCIYIGDEQIPIGSYVMPYDFKKETYSVFYLDFIRFNWGLLPKTKILKKVKPKHIKKCTKKNFDNAFRRILNISYLNYKYPKAKKSKDFS